MRKDPTAFRERFKKWKETGLYELPRFEDGYESFLATLPDNQRKPGAYNTRRYWELNGKPKNFAEAIGKGMYSIQEDDGMLGWHANSVSYNENNDTYEFMKPNYHPTRWMELVEGYDKDSEFLKDWKVLYNGPMLSDRYVRREKPGLKVKGGQLPRFACGTEGGYTRLNGNPVAFDKEGNLIDQITGLKGTMLLPDLNVTAAHPKNYRSSYDPELITEFTDLIPGVGDVLYGIKAIDAYNKGDYMYAGMLGAGLAAPTILSKPLKYIGKKVSKFIPSEQYQKKLLEKYNNMSSNDLMLYPAFYGGLIGGLPGMYTMITSDNLGEGALGLAESIIGGGAGAGAGLRLALMLNKKGLKKYYNLTLDGIKPKLSKNSITSDVLFNNKKASSLVSTRMKGLKSGDSYALIGDSELSTDSSPLYYLLLARHKNIGDIHPVLNSAGEISYQKLNSYGHYHSIEDINRSILTFNKTTGLNLPSTRLIENTIYIPSVYITKR